MKAVLMFFAFFLMMIWKAEANKVFMPSLRVSCNNFIRDNKFHDQFAATVEIYDAKPNHKVAIAWDEHVDGRATWGESHCEDHAVTPLRSIAEERTQWGRADSSGYSKFRVFVDQCSQFAFVGLSAPYREKQCQVTPFAKQGPFKGVEMTLSLGPTGMSLEEAEASADAFKEAFVRTGSLGKYPFFFNATTDVVAAASTASSQPALRKLLQVDSIEVVLKLQFMLTDFEKGMVLMARLDKLFVDRIKGKGVRNDLKDELARMGLANAKNLILRNGPGYFYEIMNSGNPLRILSSTAQWNNWVHDNDNVAALNKYSDMDPTTLDPATLCYVEKVNCSARLGIELSAECAVNYNLQCSRDDLTGQILRHFDVPGFDNILYWGGGHTGRHQPVKSFSPYFDRALKLPITFGFKVYYYRPCQSLQFTLMPKKALPTELCDSIMCESDTILSRLDTDATAELKGTPRFTVSLPCRTVGASSGLYGEYAQTITGGSRDYFFDNDALDDTDWSVWNYDNTDPDYWVSVKVTIPADGSDIVIEAEGVPDENGEDQVIVRPQNLGTVPNHFDPDDQLWLSYTTIGNGYADKYLYDLPDKPDPAQIDPMSGEHTHGWQEYQGDNTLNDVGVMVKDLWVM